MLFFKYLPGSRCNPAHARNDCGPCYRTGMTFKNGERGIFKMKNKVSMLSAIAVAILLAASLTILLPAEGGGGEFGADTRYFRGYLICD